MSTHRTRSQDPDEEESEEEYRHAPEEEEENKMEILTALQPTNPVVAQPADAASIAFPSSSSASTAAITSVAIPIMPTASPISPTAHTPQRTKSIPDAVKRTHSGQHTKVASVAQQPKTTFGSFSLRVVFDSSWYGLRPSRHFPIPALDCRQVSHGSRVGPRRLLDRGCGSPSSATLQTNLCMKILKNQKEFLDQALDEIRRLTLLNSAQDALVASSSQSNPSPRKRTSWSSSGHGHGSSPPASSWLPGANLYEAMQRSKCCALFHASRTAEEALIRPARRGSMD
jgi:hypothetical protein